MAGSSYGRPALVLASVVLIAACSGSAATGSPTSSSPRSEPPSAAPSSPSGTAPTADDGLVLLASDAAKGRGLWVYGDGGWSQVASEPHADAIASSGDGILVGDAQSLESRPATGLSSAARTIQLTWPGGVSTQKIDSIAMSASGGLAFAIGSQGSISYALAGPNGTVSSVDVAPSQPFTPLVAWLDQTRRLVMSMDGQQASHLAVSAGRNTFTDLTGLAGCRWFAVSADGGTIAAVTDSQIYVGPADLWLASSAPRAIASVPAGSVVWGLALDRTGGKLAALAGVVGSDGTVGEIRDLVYALTGGAWQKTLDLKVPLDSVVGQAWAN